MHQIVPAILTSSFEDLKKNICRYDGLFSTVHIDIMDGKFVHDRSFTEVEKVKEIGTELKYELHLMVNDAAAELKRWIEIENVSKVIVHIESPGDIEAAWEIAKKQGWEFSIAINPDTPLQKLDPHLECIDEVLLMTVYPGRQGGQFQSKVLPKIKEYLAFPKHPKCAVDGGINKETITNFKDLQIDNICIGSALMLSPDPGKTYSELKEILN